MKPRRVQTWVWWLLPFLVARALMPVGFMAQGQGGDFKLVFCSSVAALADHFAANDRSHATDAGQPDHSPSDSSSHDQSDLSCPFGHAAPAPLLDLSGSEAIAFIAAAVHLPHAEPPYLAVGPPRAVSARGPPQLA